MEEAVSDQFEEYRHEFDKVHSFGNYRLTDSCREVGLGYVAQELVDYPHEDVDQLDNGYSLPEYQADYAEQADDAGQADYIGQAGYSGQQEDGAIDSHNVPSDLLMTQAIDVEASLRAGILDLGRRMRGATAEPDIREREFFAASNSNGHSGCQDIGFCASLDGESAINEVNVIHEVDMPRVTNGWSHEDQEEPAEIRPGLRGLAAAAGGPAFGDYLLDADDDLGLDTPEAIWRPPLMRRPPDRPVARVAQPEMANGGSAASYSSFASREAGSSGVQSSPHKLPPPDSATAAPRPHGRGWAGAAPPIASSGTSTASNLGSGGGGSSSASTGSDSARRAAGLERARQPHASREECNRPPHGMQPRGARPARSAEVQALQAEVAMQEVQLRRLLTAQPGENIPDEVAFEAARLWQGLESIRSVIGTLQERIGEEGAGLSEEMLSASDAGFVEDAYVVKAEGHSQGSRGRMSSDGNPDGFDEIAQLEAATSVLTRQPRGRNAVAAAGLPQEERRQVPERQGAFRGLVRGSGTGGGASTRVNHTSAKRQDRPSTPLKQTPRQHGMPGKFSARRSSAPSQVSSAVNIGVGSATKSGGSAAFGGTRLKSPTRERRSVSAPRGATSRRAASPAPKVGERPASPRSSSTMRRTTSPVPKSRSRPTSPGPRSPRGQPVANNSGGQGRATVVQPHTPPPPPKRSPMDGRDNESLPRRGGAGTPHSPSSQHSVVVRASGSNPGAASYWKHTGVAPMVLHGGAAADHAVLAPVTLHGGAAADHAVLAGVQPVNGIGGLGTPADSAAFLGGAAAPPMPL